MEGTAGHPLLVYRKAQMLRHLSRGHRLLHGLEYVAVCDFLCLPSQMPASAVSGANQDNGYGGTPSRCQ